MNTVLAWGGGHAGFCMSFVHALRSHVVNRGRDAAPVMAALGCSPQTRPGGGGPGVTASQLSAGLSEAARTLDDEQVGLRIGIGMTPSHLGALGHAAMTASNGLSGMALYEELQALCMTEIVMTRHNHGALIQIRGEGTGSLPNDHRFWSFFLGWRLNLVRGACGQRVVPERVALPCPPPPFEGPMREFVGAAVQFNAPGYEEWFPAACLHAPNPHGSPEIHAVMAIMARSEWRALVDPDEALISNLKREILQALERGESPTLGSLAPRLARIKAAPPLMMISARQLQRRLTVRQLSFRCLVADVRRERALVQLRSTNRPLADIAAEAGYAELSSFHRAIRRWTGSTPVRIRNEGEDCLHR